MKPFHAAVATVAAVVLFVSASANAATVLYDFEDQDAGSQTPFIASSTPTGLIATFASPDDTTYGDGAFGISSNFLTSTGYQYRLLTGNFLTIGNAFVVSPSVLTVTFSAPITGLSFDFALDDSRQGDPDNLTRLTVSTDSGATFTTSGSLADGFLYPEDLYAFASAPFTVATFSSTANDFQLDNLRATAAVARVPEPGAWLLLGIGLVPLVAARRRTAARLTST